MLRRWAPEIVVTVTAIVVLLGVAGAAYLAGRLSVEPTVETEAVVERDLTRELELAAQVATLQRQLAEAESRVIDRVVTRVVYPDGTKWEQERQHEETHRQTTVIDVAQATQVSVRDRVEYRDREVTEEVRTHAPIADWRVGLLAGVELDQVDRPVPLVGATASARVKLPVIGRTPVWVGAWVLARPEPVSAANKFAVAAGVAASWEF